MTLAQLIENTVYFIALINPVSKIFFMASQHPPYSTKQLVNISVKSNLVSLGILIVLACIGDYLLTRIFRIEIYSLSVAGGIILFSMGLNAVKQGSFLNASENSNHNPADPSVVPLATPMIAGPGAMTATIALASTHGVITTIICVAIAILLNFVLMLLSQPINRGLSKLNATSTIIRIMGLIVTAIATQMIFSGCTMWLSKIT